MTKAAPQLTQPESPRHSARPAGVTGDAMTVPVTLDEPFLEPTDRWFALEPVDRQYENAL